MVCLRSSCHSSVISSGSFSMVNDHCASANHRFWGDMIRNAGAGPSPIPPKELTSDRLAEAIQFAYSEPAQEAAKRMGETIRAEDGVEAGVASFQRQLPLLHMR
jgi:hypothetical protein